MESIRQAGLRLSSRFLFLLWLGMAPAVAVDLGPSGELNEPPGISARQKLIATAREEGRWKEVSAAMVRQLLEARRRGEPWGAGMEQRLRLAQIFDQLGTLDTDAGVALVRRFWQSRSPRAFPEDAIRKSLPTQGAREKFAFLFGDAVNLPVGERVASRVPDATLDRILNSPRLLSCLGQVILEEDYLPGVWRVLGDLVAHNPAAVEAYPELLAAMSVVHDQGFPRDWPHHQVRQEDVPHVFGQWNALLDYWIERNRQGQLLVDIQKLRSDQLVFLVDVGVGVDELAWAAGRIKNRRDQFADVFGIVNYDTQRAQDGKYDWPEGVPYSLADILDRGGICVDQAYFAFLAGKAVGLPTLYFSGQGSDGGHAWFGYLKRDNAWDMDAGRYKNQNYVVGEALDPQTWEPINDHQLEQIAKENAVSPSLEQSRMSLTLGGLALANSMPEAYHDMLEDARKICPENVEAWLQIAETFDPAKQSAELEQHWMAMLEKFQNEPDLRTYVLQQLITLKTTQGNTAEVAALQERIINENRNRRSDLAVVLVWDRIKANMDTGNAYAAMETYRSELRSLRDTGGGNLFYEVVRPFVQRLTKEGKPDLARDALKLARKQLQIEDDSLLGREVKKLEDDLHETAP